MLALGVMFGDALTALQPKRRKQNSTEFRVVWCVTVVRMNVPFVILLSTRFIRCESGSDVISGRKFPHTEPERQICLLFIFLSPTFWMLWLLLCVTTERTIAGYIVYNTLIAHLMLWKSVRNSLCYLHCLRSRWLTTVARLADVAGSI